MIKINSLNAFSLIIISVSLFPVFDLNSKDIPNREVDILDSVPDRGTSDSLDKNKPVTVDTVAPDSLIIENTDSNTVPLGGPPGDKDDKSNLFEEGASSEYVYPSTVDMENIPDSNIESYPGGKVVPIGASPDDPEELYKIKNTESEYNEEDDRVSEDRAKDKN